MNTELRVFIQNPFLMGTLDHNPDMIDTIIEKSLLDYGGYSKGDLMDLAFLKEKAQQAAQSAYAPYSRFRVGAAILYDGDSVVCGCNVENRSYGLTICAERSAVVAAVSRGYRDIKAVAIYSPDSKGPIPPCGACRQVLSEFADPETPVVFGGTEGEWTSTTIAALIPYDSLQGLKNVERS